jgi:lipopolysaccharide biosynthesis glycosyltransferase
MEMDMKEEINICLSTDDNYIQHTATVVASILCNAKRKDNYHFYILSTQLSDDNKKKFDKLKKIKDCKIDYPKLDEKILAPFKAVKMHAHLTLATFNRLLIPMLFPKLDKMIYIDSDLVVLSDIADMNNIDVSGYYFAGVKDANSKGLVKKHGYDPKYEYINAGVIIINCAELRKQDYFKRMLKQIGKIEARTGDQDFINCCFHKKIKIISYKWNMYHKFHFEAYGGTPPMDDPDYANAVKNPVIVHFVGPDKPWNIASMHPYKKEYLKYLQMTPWAEKAQMTTANDFISNKNLYPQKIGIISLGCDEMVQSYLNTSGVYTISQDNYMPFDNCYSSLVGVISLLKNNFSNIYQDIHFNEERGYFINETLGLYYNKDRDCGTDFNKFRQRLDERISHFKVALSSEKPLFFILKASSNPTAINELYSVLKMKRGKKYFRLIVVDQKNKLTKLDANIIHCNILSPYNDNTGWYNSQFNQTKEALEYVQKIVNFIKKEIKYCVKTTSHNFFVKASNSKEKRTYLTCFGIKIISYKSKKNLNRNSKESTLRLLGIPILTISKTVEKETFCLLGIRIAKIKKTPKKDIFYLFGIRVGKKTNIKLSLLFFSFQKKGIYRICKLFGIPFCFWRIAYTTRAQFPQNLKAIKKLKNKYKGKRCFIIGGAPSLNQLDLTKLNNEYTCTVGKGYKLVEKGLKHSTFHVFGDIFGYVESFPELDVKFSDIYFVRSAIDFLNPVKPILFDIYDSEFNPASNGFQTNLCKPLYCGRSVVIYALQIMAYLGFEKIYLIGIDLDFTTKDAHAYTSTEGEEWRTRYSVYNRQRMYGALEFGSKFLKKQKKQVINASAVKKLPFLSEENYENLFK